MSQPFFSIIIPVYQTEPFFEECLLSLREQTFSDFECVVICDGSTGVEIGSDQKNSEFWFRSSFENKIIPKGVELSGQAKYIFDRTVGMDIRYTFVTQQNQGASFAKNTGIKLAEGKKVVFVDSDDFLEFNYLSNAYETINKNSNKVVFGQVKNLINEEKQDFRTGQRFFAKENNLANILITPTYTCTPVNYFWNLDLIKKNNIEFASDHAGEDTKFMLDNLFIAIQNGYENEFISTRSDYIYRQFAGQVTRENDFQIRLFEQTTQYMKNRIKDFAKLGFGYRMLAVLFVKRYSLFRERLLNEDKSWNLFYRYYPKLLTAMSVLIAKITK
jgi:glycosyltransferase involved in cell wall biosynthesis